MKDKDYLKIMRRFTVLFLLAFCISESSAQDIRGIVTGDGKPLSYATVVMSDKDSMVLGRTMSDSIGTFRFNNVGRSEAILHARCLGYKANSIRIETKDSIVTCEIALKADEITLKGIEVNGTGITRKEGYTLIVPTRNAIRHSADGYTLLTRLGIPDIQTDRRTQTVSNFNGEVTLYINGAKAERHEIKALRPQDIKSIEYHDFPLGKYAQDKAAINFITARHTYGGFISLEGKGTLGYGDNEANGVFKLSKGARNLTIWSGYRHSDIKTKSDESETLWLPAGRTDLSQNKEIMANSMHESYLQASLTHISDNRMWMIRGGVDASNRPKTEAKGALTVNGIPDMLAENTHERHLSPTLNLYLYQTLSKRQSIELTLDGTYRNTTYSRHYAGNEYSASADIDEHFFSARFTAGYTILLKHRNQITAQLHNYFKASRADYAGDTGERQNLTSDETILFISYSQAAGKRWIYHINPGMSWISYRMHGRGAVSHVSPRLNLMASYMLRKNQRLQLSVNVGNTYPLLYTMNGVRQSINQYKAIKGNASLDNSVLLSPALTYNASIGRAGISSSASYFHATNAIVNSYTPDGSQMLTSYTDGYRQNTFTYNLGMSWRITDNLMIKLQGEYKHMNYLGANRTFVNAANGYAQIDCTKGSLMLSLWGKTAVKLLLSDMSEIKSLPQFGLDLGWNRNGWSIELNVNSPFLKDRKSEARIRTDVYACVKSDMDKSCQQNLTLKARYTFNFGKKTEQTRKYSKPETETGIIKPE